MEELYKFVHNEYRVWEYEDHCPINIRPKEPVYDDSSEIQLEEVSSSPKREHWIFKPPLVLGEENYVNNYSNLLTTILHNRFSIILTKNINKVSVKIFTYRRLRNKGRKFFKVTTRVDYLTFNLETNCTYIGYINNYHKKRKSTSGIRKNEFYTDPFNRILVMITNRILEMSEYNPNLNLHKSDIIDEVTSIFFKNIPQSQKYNNYKPSERLYKLYMDSIGAKTPNNWNIFINQYPIISLKLLRNNEMKLINGFMMLKKLRGDKIKKILHTIDKIGSLSLYQWSVNFFGFDFINGQSDDFLKSLIENNHYFFDVENNSFSKKEKNNIFEIFKLVLNSSINPATFGDHLSMYEKIKNFEEVKWKSRNYEQFRDEHLQYTERVSFYTKGEFSRVYDREFKNKIQEPILNEYYPVLLETSTEYNMESFIQSNCVKGYVDNASSIIISLRKNEFDSKERATIEFIVERIKGTLKLIRNQALGRFNYPLSPEWDQSIEILEKRFKDLLDENIFKLYTCTYKIGYNTYVSGVVFKEYLGWDGLELERLVWEEENFGWDTSHIYVEDQITELEELP